MQKNMKIVQHNEPKTGARRPHHNDQLQSRAEQHAAHSCWEVEHSPRARSRLLQARR